MRRRTPGFVACAEINSKARDAVDIDIIKLLVILDITFQLELKLKTKRWRDLGWPFMDRHHIQVMQGIESGNGNQIWLDTRKLINT